MTEDGICVELSVPPELWDLDLAAFHSGPILGAGVAAVSGIATSLGISSSVTLDAVRGSEGVDSLELTVNGWRCQPPANALWSARSIAEQVFPSGAGDWQEAVAWLQADGNADVLSSFVSAWLTLVVEGQPAVLVSDQIAESMFGDGTQVPGLDWAADRLGRILRRVVALGRSIGDHEAIASVLSTGAGCPDEVVVERIIAARPAAPIELHLNKSMMRRITLGLDDIQEQPLAFLRDSMFYELGVVCPDFEFVLDEMLPDECFAFRIHDVMTPPVRALPPDTALVNLAPSYAAELSERGLLGEIDADLFRPAVNPSSVMTCSLVPSGLVPQLEALSVTTWREADLFILVLATVIRRRAGSFVDTVSTARLVELLRPFNPSLTDAVARVEPDDFLSAKLRGLVEGGVAVNDLEPVLERLVELWASDEEATPDVLRRCLARSTTSRIARDSGTVVCYLLTKEVEVALADLSAALGPVAALAGRRGNGVPSRLRS